MSSSFLLSSSISYSAIDFLFVDSHRNESLSNLFSIDSQGFIRTLVVLDRELQSNHTLSIFMYDPVLKSYSLPTSIIIRVLDENDNLPFEPYLANPYELSIEQINNDETIIYEFKPMDLDDGPNGLISIDCLNCTSSYYFYLKFNNSTNSTALVTKVNRSIPVGIYTLAFVLRDHGVFISRERIYTLTFNLTHRSFEEGEENFLRMPTTTMINSLFIKPKTFLSKIFFQKFQWRFLILLIVSWIVLVLIALWTCYRYDRIVRRKQRDKDQQEQFEIQVRQHEIINPPMINPTKPSAQSIHHTQQFYEKEVLTADDDEVEDTSYDADHIITDANFVLTSGCAANESHGRYVSSF